MPGRPLPTAAPDPPADAPLRLTPPLAISPLRAAITALARAPEPELLPGLLAQATLPPAQADAAQALALRLARALRERSRDAGRAGLVQGLLQEFALSSAEGVALMCLAEALLRIPDAATRDALIRDKIGQGGHADWQRHLGRSPSLFVNAAAWGLLLTGKLVATHSEGGLGATLKRAVARGGEPLIRKGVDLAMRLMGEQFVTGETIGEALANARAREAQGFRYSYDMLGEAALTAADAMRYFDAYARAIDAIGAAAAEQAARGGAGWCGPVDGPGISIKLSALHPRYARAQVERVQAELLPRLVQLAAMAKLHDMGFNIDAEEADRLELSLDLLEALAFEPALAGWNGLGFVIQAYGKRCPAVIDWLIDLARRSGRRLMVRLVKGAYWDSEIKRAQLDGQDGYPVYTRKPYTDVAYVACARKLLAAPDAVFPQFATHNAHTLAAVYTLADPEAWYPGQYEFQCLHGMGEPLYEQVVGADAGRPVRRGEAAGLADDGRPAGHRPAPSAAGALGRPCRIYAPVGTHETLLAYLVRRLLENGANTSFVNRVADPNLALDELVEDPVRTVRAMAEREGTVGAPHPAIALPRALYAPARLNSRGLDLADESTLAALARAQADDAARVWRVVPMIAGMAGTADTADTAAAAAAGTAAIDSAAAAAAAETAAIDGAADAAAAVTAATTAPAAVASGADPAAAEPVRNPADPADIVGHVREAGAGEVQAALATAVQAAPAWGRTPPAERAAILDAAADRLEADLLALVPLLVREAGKTQANAVAEVREAVDFLRYDALQLRRDFDAVTHAPLGPVLCISPWNFPLAIFTGQVAAALAAGNVVLAKPAEQTPLVAAAAVAALHEAGVPRGALQLLPGRGETVGAALVADARVQGVLFTGSTEVARLLQRTLAQRLNPDGRPVPLIAETGGQNAMVVDSSALAEQAVADIVASAFDSAGQRCSALRVLCVQDDVADRLVEMLHGAVQELRIGDPRELATDVGPVIDADAQANIEGHVAAMAQRGRRVWRAELPPGLAGHFVPPTIIEIDRIAELEREVFGPVLHLLRWRRDELPQLLDAVAATGYGLTQGVHTRIDETVAQVVAASRAGNVYVNRNVVGAVVGVQPFGGEGLSGTGPKAGGPLYLLRLLRARPPLAPRLAAARSGREAAPPVRGLGDVAVASAADARAALRDWARSKGLAELAAWCDQAVAEAPVCGWTALPGPTGEANLYAVQPRGHVLCLAEPGARGDRDRLVQLAAVLAVDAQAVWPADDLPLAERLPPDVRARITVAQDWAQPAVPFDVVLHHGDAAARLDLAQRLAQRPGPIVGLVALEPGEWAVPLERLVLERSLSINTAAAGGNASLMTIG